MARRRSLTSRVARDGLTMLGAGVAARQQTGALVEPSEAVGAVLDAMPEREFQQHVEEALTSRGYLWWHVRDPRLMRAGLPDIIAVHPTRVPRRLILWELKTATGRATQKQREALAALSNVPGVDARIVRPSDWQTLSEEV